MAKLAEIRDGQSVYDVVSNYDNVLFMMAQNGVSSSNISGSFSVDEELDKKNPVDIKKSAAPEEFEQMVYDNQNIYDLIFQSTNNYDNVLGFMVKNSIQNTYLLPKKIIFAKSEIKDKFKYQRGIRPATGMLKIETGCGIGYWAIESDFVVDGNCDGTVNDGIGNMGIEYNFVVR